MTPSTNEMTREGSGRLKDKVAIVTGASSGIGRAIALFYAAEKAHVVVADIQDNSRNTAEADVKTHDKIKEMGQRSMFVKTDVTSSANVDALVKQVVAEFGRLDIMVNNAGTAFEIASPGNVWEMTDSTWQKTMDLNCSGVFYGVRAAAAQMVKQDPFPSGERGWIINIASIMGTRVGAAGGAAYTASKALVSGLTKASALELSPHRVHVNTICPGYVKTAFLDKVLEDEGTRAHLEAGHPFGGMGEPQDVARIAVFLASDDSRWVQGAEIVVDGAFTIQ